MKSLFCSSEPRTQRPCRFLGSVCLASLFLPSAHALAQNPQTQVRFTGPTGMEIRWLYRKADGKDVFSETPLVVPGRFNFRQGGLYRLKMSRIPGHPGLDVYPTLEVPVPPPAAQEYLAHNAVPLELTVEDLREIAEAKQVTKIVHLEGDSSLPRLLILRIGNVDLETPGGGKK